MCGAWNSSAHLLGLRRGRRGTVATVLLGLATRAATALLGSVLTLGRIGGSTSLTLGTATVTRTTALDLDVTGCQLVGDRRRLGLTGALAALARGIGGDRYVTGSRSVV